MIEYEVVKLMWKSSKKDLIPMFVTFSFCLIVGVEYGILLGVGINLMFLLYPSARPTIHVDKCTVGSKNLEIFFFPDSFKTLKNICEKLSRGLHKSNENASDRIHRDIIDVLIFTTRLNLAHRLRHRPILLQTDRGAEYLLVTPGNSLYFPAIDFIKQSVGNAAIKQGSSQVPVVVDCRYILGADFTAAKVIPMTTRLNRTLILQSAFQLIASFPIQGMKTLIDEFSNRKQGLYFYNPRSDVVTVLKGACGDEFQYVSTQEELSYLLTTLQGN